eukprot:gene7426-11749_t
MLQQQLVGHKKIVNSMDIKDTLLSTGSDDGTCRIYDLKTNKTICCIITPEKSHVSSLQFSKENELFFSSKNKLFSFDLRKFDIISSNFLLKKELSKDSDNEINQIKLNSEGTKLIAGDDSGAVSIIDSKNFDVISTENSHEVICSSVGFLSNGEYFSGGMDCKFVHVTPKKTFKIDFQTETKDKKIFNPPLVHSLATNSKYIAAGLGNSKCQLIDATNHSLGSCLENHSYIVNQVEFAEFSPEKFLVTGSLDST